MKYEILRVVEAIPYKSNEELKSIVEKYRDDSVVQLMDKFVYVERIEVA